MKRCNLKYIKQEYRKFFFSDQNGYVPLPGDAISDFNFDWGPLQNMPADTVQQKWDKKAKRRDSFSMACSENMNIAHVKCGIDTNEWKDQDVK